MARSVSQGRAIDPADNDLLRRARECLDRREYSLAIRELRARLSRPLPSEGLARGLLLGNVGAVLIDLGTEGGDATAVEEAIDLYEAHRSEIREVLGPTMFHYNLGNGLRSLADFKVRESEVWNLDLTDAVTAAKNQYWLAVRLSERPTPDVLVNLANTLRDSRRVSEALYWYDCALARSPAHPMAHANRSHCLRLLGGLTGTYSYSMLEQISRGYEDALSSGDVPEEAKAGWRVALGQTKDYLAGRGRTTEEVEDDHAATLREAQEHSEYRMFCIREHLMLAEHALYCPCSGSRRDSLSIPTTAGVVGDYVPAMELLLNRVKAEFNLARLLFFQSSLTATPAWDTEPFEGTYTDLLDESTIDVRSELLRTSFRLCFGIFDRIAFGICSLFKLAQPEEVLYFHSFWRGRRGSQQDRWSRLNELAGLHPSLAALYSQGTDFHHQDGEWRHLRSYRNNLEHELMLLSPTGDESLGPFAEDRFFKRLEAVSLPEFRSETLHLLRFVASGILSFALLVRQKAYRENRGEGDGVPFVFLKKPIGPR